MITAFAKVRKETDAKLVICGKGEDELALKSLAKELGVEKDVLFLGLVPYKELPKYVSAADVFVRASISEGFGNSFVEALACEVPIIGTRVGGIPDFLTDKKTGLFCKVKDPDDLAEKILLLLEDEKLAHTIGETGKKMVTEKYQWAGIAQQFDEVFKRI